MKAEWAIVLHRPGGMQQVLPFRVELEAEIHLLCRQLQETLPYRLTYRRVRAKEWLVYRLGLDGTRLPIGEFESREKAEEFARWERVCHRNARQFERGVDPLKPHFLFTVEKRLMEVT